MTWFTSDQHFLHSNIINYCDRPFSTIEEMDEKLIEDWNAFIKDGDTIFHLGDFSLGTFEQVAPIFKRLNGRIVMLDMDWHHDRRWIVFARHSAEIKNLKLISPSTVIKLDEQYIHLSHYPLARWDRQHYGSWHLFGHCHGRFRPVGLAMDVGVDAVEHEVGKFRPLSLDEVKCFMDDKEINKGIDT